MADVGSTIQISGTIQGISQIGGSISLTDGISAELLLPDVVPLERYTGEYEFTPSDEVQVVSVRGMNMTEDIVINPVPSNYGRITWDGATLTVS